MRIGYAIFIYIINSKNAIFAPWIQFMSVNLQPNDKLLKDELTKRLLALEKYLNADVMSYTGVIADDIPPKVKGVIENLASSKDKKDTLFIILTTTGGSANAVDIYVNILRHHYTTLFSKEIVGFGRFVFHFLLPKVNSYKHTIYNI